MPKYKYGDRVQVNGHAGTVKSVRTSSSGGYECTVYFDDPNLIPPFMEVPENHIKPYYGGTKKYEYDNRFSYKRIMNGSEYCPVCNTKWHTIEHPIFGKKQVWKDCLKCKKTQEQIMESKNVNHNYD